MLLLDERFRESLPLVLDFLGVFDRGHPSPRMDPDGRQRQLFAVGATGRAERLAKELGE